MHCMQFADRSCDVVLDKGSLDALMGDESPERLASGSAFQQHQNSWSNTYCNPSSGKQLTGCVRSSQTAALTSSWTRVAWML